MISKIKKTFFQQPTFNLITGRNSSTIVVFVHGILSGSESAFNVLDDKKWWDIIKNEYPFNGFDFAYYNYNRTNLANIIHLSSPVNNAGKLANTLNKYISKYLNVILVGHSQGGLISKRYTVDFANKQNIYLMTMHTPHLEELSGVVMKSGVKEEWDNNVSFSIQHLFAASDRDQIVQVDNALDGNRSIEYISQTDRSVKSDGHSYLNINPDLELVELLIGNIHYFLNSGLNANYDFANISTIERTICIVSSSNLKMQEYISSTTQPENYIDAWEYAKKVTNKLPSVIYLSSLNSNFFTNLKNNIQFKNIDKNKTLGYHDEILMYKFALEELSSNENLYEKLPFDKFLIENKFLIELTDFYYILNKNIQTNNITLKNYFEYSNYEDADEKIKQVYILSLVECKLMITHYSMNCCSNINDEKFTKSFEIFIYNLNIKKYTYTELHSIIKQDFYNNGITLSTYNIECIFSKLFRVINYHYYLNKNIYKLFKLDIEGLLNSHLTKDYFDVTKLDMPYK